MAMKIMGNDVLREVLLRMDPPSLVSFLLSSREWFQVIKDPSFREAYMRKWKELVGFLVQDQLFSYSLDSRSMPLAPLVQLLPTSQLGRILNHKHLMPPDIGIFIAKSANNCFILSGIRSKKYYVFNPLRKHVDRLPWPPKCFPPFAIAIIDDGNIGYQVIRAKIAASPNNILTIQKYSSTTRMWVKLKSRIPSSSGLTKFEIHRGEIGTVTRGGMIFWRAIVKAPHPRCLLAYDTNTACITLVKLPFFLSHKPSMFKHLDDFDKIPDVNESDWSPPLRGSNYGESPEGFLRCAMSCCVFIKIWMLDHYDYYHEPDFENDYDDAGWSLVCNIDLLQVWVDNSSLLGLKCKRPFYFVSFVDGKWDSIYVRLIRRFFIYHLETGMLERVQYYLDDGGYNFPEDYGIGNFNFCPLTMTEFGAWPWQIFHQLDI